MKTYAYLVDYGEGRWIRFWNTSQVWEEPTADYEYVIDLIRGGSVYRHKVTGKTYTHKEEE